MEAKDGNSTDGDERPFSEAAAGQGTPDQEEGQDVSQERPAEALRGLARRFLRTGTEFVLNASLEEEEAEEEESQNGEAKRRPLKTVASLAGRGKSELGKLALGELRGALDAMDLPELLSRYSLEVKASIRLKDLAKGPASDEDEGTDG